mgnify:FL=1
MPWFRLSSVGAHFFMQLYQSEIFCHKGMKSIPINEPWIQMITENSLQTESHMNSSHIL